MKRLVALLMVAVVSVFLVTPVMAASGVSSVEQKMLDEFKANVESKRHLLGDKIADQWETEAEHALMQVELSADACADLTQCMKDVMKYVTPIATREKLKEVSDEAVAMINKVSKKYGLTVSLSATTGFGTVKWDGKTIIDPEPPVRQTGTALAPTAVVAAVLLVSLSGAAATVRRKHLFA